MNIMQITKIIYKYKNMKIGKREIDFCQKRCNFELIRTKK